MELKASGVKFSAIARRHGLCPVGNDMQVLWNRTKLRKHYRTELDTGHVKANASRWGPVQEHACFS